MDRNGNKTRYRYDGNANLIGITDALGQTTELAYDGKNRLISIRQPGGGNILNTYDEAGNLISREDQLGNVMRIRYDGRRKPVAVLQPDGSEICLRYDERGNITEITDEMGNRTCYGYDGLNRVTVMTDGNGNRTVFSYNERNDIVKIVNALGKEKRYGYSPSGKITEITDFDGTVQRVWYDACNRPERYEDQAGNITEYGYDRMGNLACEKMPNGGSRRFVYDKYNRLVQYEDACGGKTKYTYDSCGNRVKAEDAEGGTTYYVYDALHRLTEVTDADGRKTVYGYHEDGNITCITDPAGNKTYIKYDAAGRKTEEKDALGNITMYSYNALGKLTQIKDGIGRITKFEYYPGGLPSRIIYPDGKMIGYAYDGNCNIKEQWDGSGYHLYYAYDGCNRLISIKSNEGQEVCYSYDDVGHITVQGDAGGNLTKYGYSPSGQLISAEDPEGNMVRYDYDNMGDLRAVFKAGNEKEAGMEFEDILERSGRSHDLHLVLYERDLEGKVTAVTDALGNRERYEYDMAGRMIRKTDREGYQTVCTYTAGGQMETVTFGDGRKAEYSYGPLKQLVEIRDWLGKTTAEYDRYGRVMKITDHRGKSVAYEWGSMNQKKAVIYPDGSRVNYFYDNLMRLKELTSGNNRIGYRYGENGLPEEISCNNGLTTSYCYNHAGKITGLTHKMHDVVLEDYKYEYDKTGNKTGIFKYRRGVPKESGTFRYGYDRAGHLTSVEKDGKMLREYAYDSFHNRSRMEDSVGRTEYTYDSMDQMVQSMGREQYAYHYDKRGNLIEILQNGAAGNSYAYDAMGKIREAGTAGGEGCRYIYNGAGMRVSREERGIRNKNIHTDYVLDMTRSCHNLLVRENGETKQKYIWGNLLAGMEEEGRDSYALLDELGSPVRFLWRNGNDLSVYGYDEFGNDLFGNAGDKQPFGFTGYLADGISGTYFAQAREYAPESGRFYGEDIIPGDMSAGVSLNRYIYCANDPVNYVDWDGRLLVRMLVGAVVGMAADFGAQVINNVIEGKNVFDLDNYNGVEILMSGVGGALMAAVPSAANWVAKNISTKVAVAVTYIGNAAIAGGTSAATEKISNPQATSEDIRNVAFRGAVWSLVGTTAGYLVSKIPLISNISKTAEFDLWRVTPMGGGGYTTQSNPQVVRNNVKIMQRLLFGVDQGTSATTTIAVSALGSGMRIRMEEEKE